MISQNIQLINWSATHHFTNVQTLFGRKKKGVEGTGGKTEIRKAGFLVVSEEYKIIFSFDPRVS